MSLSIVLLTSDAPHRRYIVDQLAHHVPIRSIIVSVPPSPPFETDHPFEQREMDYENQTCFDGKPVEFSKIAETRHFDSVNHQDCFKYLDQIGPDLIVDVGTGPLHSKIIGLARTACLNVHGGDPEFYRGIDCHLWPIYNHDFDKIAVALHYITPEIDKGDMIMKTQIPITADLELYMLRSRLMEQVAGMLTLALDGFMRHGWLPAYHQRSVGRYYSFMPTVLKEACLSIFQKHRAALLTSDEIGVR